MRKGLSSAEDDQQKKCLSNHDCMPKAKGHTHEQAISAAGYCVTTEKKKNQRGVDYER